MSGSTMPVVPRLAPAACFGSVAHERHVEKSHKFNYPAAFLRLPLAQLDQLKVPLLGIERANLFSFRSGDHGPRDGSPLLPWLRKVLAANNLAAVCDGEVVLQTMPRVLGYVFNPVSLWYCHDRAGALRVVLVEVNNTFGEHHNYLVHHPDLHPIRPCDQLVARKRFHVSPFFPVRGEYRLRFGGRGAAHATVIELWDGGVLQLGTHLAGRARPLDGAAMMTWLLKYPTMVLGVMARIHWQALRLYLRGVSFHTKPLPPTEETTS